MCIITDLTTVLLTGPLHTGVWGESLHVAAGHVTPPTAPGPGDTLTDDLKNRYPVIPGSGEWDSVPGKVMPRPAHVR